MRIIHHSIRYTVECLNIHQLMDNPLDVHHLSMLSLSLASQLYALLHLHEQNHATKDHSKSNGISSIGWSRSPVRI
jgi:hypothetical protein